MNQKRVGIVITYLNLMLGMVVNVFLTPFLINTLGDVDYSLYKVIQSFASPLAMFHLGVSTIVTRSIVKCKNSEDYTEIDKKNSMAHAMIASAIMAGFVVIASAGMYLVIPSMYRNTYGSESISKGQTMFLIYAASSVLHMLTDAFSGCLIGYEKYVISSSIALFKTAGKLILYIVFLTLGFGVISVAVADLILSAVIFFFSLGYSVLVLQEYPKMYFFDKRMMLEILSFGVAILLQAFVNQVNNNVDTMILGACIEEKRIITMYSSALAIYSIYNSIVSAISNFFLPDATKLVNSNASGAKITDFVIQRGRIQAIIAVACICGFALSGRNFIVIWIGDQYIDAYWVTLLLMIPVTIPLVENAMISVLDATLKRIVRSAVLVLMAVLNISATIFLIQFWGFWGAAIGTAASLIIGHGIIMNIYYVKVFQVEIGRLFRSIFKGILPAGILALILCVPIAVYCPDTLMGFVLKCICFIVVYFAFLYLFGMNQSEKQIILSLRNKRKK